MEWLRCTARWQSDAAPLPGCDRHPAQRPPAGDGDGRGWQDGGGARWLGIALGSAGEIAFLKWKAAEANRAVDRARGRAHAGREPEVAAQADEEEWPEGRE